MQDAKLIIGLEEEIGNPRLFTGREKELDYFLKWVERVKQRLGGSLALLARKRRGKTALVQRLYNILYTRNDPNVIPIYFRIPDEPVEYADHAKRIFETIIRQYLAFKLRRPQLNTLALTWDQIMELAADDGAVRGVALALDAVARRVGSA